MLMRSIEIQNNTLLGLGGALPWHEVAMVVVADMTTLERHHRSTIVHQQQSRVDSFFIYRIHISTSHDSLI